VKLGNEDSMSTNSDKENLQGAYQILRYVQRALPIHSQQMHSIIEETEKNNLLLGANFSNLIDEIGDSVRKSNEIKDRLLGAELSDSHFDEIKSMLDELLHNANSVQSSVSEIMVSLQYQDSTRQILTHVQDNLEDIGLEIDGLDDNLQEPGAQDDQKLLEKIAANYTMEKEREIFFQVTGLDAGNKNDNDEEEDEITFF